MAKKVSKKSRRKLKKRANTLIVSVVKETKEQKRLRHAERDRRRALRKEAKAQSLPDPTIGLPPLTAAPVTHRLIQKEEHKRSHPDDEDDGEGHSDDEEGEEEAEGRGRRVKKEDEKEEEESKVQEGGDDAQSPKKKRKKAPAAVTADSVSDDYQLKDPKQKVRHRAPRAHPPHTAQAITPPTHPSPPPLCVGSVAAVWPGGDGDQRVQGAADGAVSPAPAAGL